MRQWWRASRPSDTRFSRSRPAGASGHPPHEGPAPLHPPHERPAPLHPPHKGPAPRPCGPPLLDTLRGGASNGASDGAERRRRGGRVRHRCGGAPARRRRPAPRRPLCGRPPLLVHTCRPLFRRPLVQDLLRARPLLIPFVVPPVRGPVPAGGRLLPVLEDRCERDVFVPRQAERLGRPGLPAHP